MNISKIILDTWSITIKNRFLWLLGILAAISTLSSRYFCSDWLFGSTANSNKTALSTINDQILSWFNTSSVLAAVLIALLLTIFLIAIYISFSARAGIILSSDEIIKNHDTNFNAAISDGQRFAFRIIGIYLFLASVAGVLGLVLTLPIALILSLNFTWAFDLGLILLIVFIIIFALTLIYLSYTALISERILLLENTTFFVTIKKAIKLVRKNFWRLIFASIINFLILVCGLIFAILLFLVFAILALGALSISAQMLAWGLTSLVAAIGALSLLVYVGFLSSFLSIYWTEIYLKITENG